MPVATSYATEAALSVFLAAELGPIGTVLGWAAGSVDAGSYAHPIALALRAYGVTTITEVTDAEAIEKLAAWKAWELAVKQLPSLYDFSLDQQSFKRSEMWKGAQAALKLALAEARPYDTSRAAARVTIGRIHHRDDPYGVPGDVLDALGVTP